MGVSQILVVYSGSRTRALGDWWGIINKISPHLHPCLLHCGRWHERESEIFGNLTFSTLSRVPTSSPPTRRSPQDWEVPGGLWLVYGENSGLWLVSLYQTVQNWFICHKQEWWAMYLVRVSSTTSRDMFCVCKFVLIWVDIQLECEVLLSKVRRMGEGLRRQLLRIPGVTRSEWRLLIEKIETF